MSATKALPGSPAVQTVRAPDAGKLATRFRTRLHRHGLDRELASGADPNSDPLRRARARALVRSDSRIKVAASVERLIAEASSPPRPFTPRVPIARPAIRDCGAELETIVERLKAPAHISPQAVAMISLLLSDGAGPLYGRNPAHTDVLRGTLQVAIAAVDHGPVLAR